jgi:hypothetical protein
MFLKEARFESVTKNRPHWTAEIVGNCSIPIKADGDSELLFSEVNLAKGWPNSNWFLPASSQVYMASSSFSFVEKVNAVS